GPEPTGAQSLEGPLLTAARPAEEENASAALVDPETWRFVRMARRMDVPAPRATAARAIAPKCGPDLGGAHRPAASRASTRCRRSNSSRSLGRKTTLRPSRT